MRWLFFFSCYFRALGRARGVATQRFCLLRGYGVLNLSFSPGSGAVTYLCSTCLASCFPVRAVVAPRETPAPTPLHPSPSLIYGSQGAAFAPRSLQTALVLSCFSGSLPCAFSCVCAVQRCASLQDCRSAGTGLGGPALAVE